MITALRIAANKIEEPDIRRLTPGGDVSDMSVFRVPQSGRAVNRKNVIALSSGLPNHVVYRLRNSLDR